MPVPGLVADRESAYSEMETGMTVSELPHGVEQVAGGLGGSGGSSGGQGKVRKELKKKKTEVKAKNACISRSKSTAVSKQDKMGSVQCGVCLLWCHFQCSRM